MTKSGFKGKFFELYCRHLMSISGYKLIPHDGKKVIYPRRGKSSMNIRMQGRGTEHQIDLPYDYLINIPMINPIRVIGEVKYYKDPIGITKIRDFFGVLEDINQNHFYASSRIPNTQGYRSLEQGLFISASGFVPNAQNFALAHNIKLLSPGSSKLVARTKVIIDGIADKVYDLIDSKSITESVATELVRYIFNHVRFLVHGMAIRFDITLLSTDAANLYREIRVELNEFVKASIDIKTVIFGNTTKGHLLMFLSKQPFPDELFIKTDTVGVAIHYTYNVETNEVDETIKVSIPIENGVYKLYTSVPKEVLNSIQSEHDNYRNAIKLKHVLFDKITFIKKINGVNRILNLKFDEDLL